MNSWSGSDLLCHCVLTRWTNSFLLSGPSETAVSEIAWHAVEKIEVNSIILSLKQ